MYESYPEPDYYQEPELAQRCYSTRGMPLVPVNPTGLTTRVIEQLESYDLVVPEKSPIMIGELCQGFNQCISDNRDGKTMTYVFSPKTGSAKSVTAKMYVSMLEKESSIIVVPRVTDAIEFCENINKWSGNRDYARCYYSLNDVNPDNELRAEKRELYRHRCIVITHSMFIRENRNLEVGYFQKYAATKRDLVIVDERINLHDRFSIEKVIVEDLVRVLEIISLSEPLDITENITTLKSVLEVFEKAAYIASDTTSTTLLINEQLLQQFNIPNCDFSRIKNLLDRSPTNLSYLISPIGRRQSAVNDSEFRKDIKEHLITVEYVMSNSFSFHKLGGLHKLMATESILSKFGTSIVLDATAEINEIYNTTAWHQSDTFKHIVTEDPRIYSNLTINKAKGFSQGADSIYQSSDEETKRDKALDYLRVAEELLSDEADKLLIVGHKSFIIMLEALNANDRIVFTNWGNHVGKNRWSDCNKVMVIGWFHLPETEYYGNFINAVGGLDYASHVLRDDTKAKYKISQLADDLVQAVMRGSSRKTISTDGNCAVSEVYIFYPPTQEGNDVMELFESQFKDATVKEWEPLLSRTARKVPTSEQNVKSIMEYLAQASKSATDVSQSDIVNETGLSKSIVSRTIKSEYCQEEFQRLGYSIVGGVRGQKTIIHLT